MESLNSISQERELHQLQLQERQMHSTDMACFKGLESHLTTLYPISDFFNEEVLILFDSAFLAFFGEEHQTFRMKMFHNLDQLQLQFKRENLHAVNTKTCLEVLRTQFKEFFSSKGVNSSDYVGRLWQEDFKDYTGCVPKTYKSDLLKYLDILRKFIDKRVLKHSELRMKENEVNALKKIGKQLNAKILHEHKIEKSFKLHGIESESNNSENALSKSVNETQMQMQEGKIDMGKALDAELVVTDSSGTKSDMRDTSNKSGNDIDALDADIRPVSNEEPRAKVQSTAEHNLLANEQQHTE
ncbi:hypothetical protein Tco_1159256 [Tanacetum coccineum]